MFKNPKVLILFFTMVVMMLGFGMIIPIMPFYVEYFGASGSGLGAMMAVFSIMQFIFSPIWGSLSDRVGRKKVLVMGILGNAISMALMGMASSFLTLFIFRGLGGILSSATMPTAMAYISDSTTEKDRGSGMGTIGAAMGVGMILGPGLGGWLVGDSLATPFFLASALSLLSMVLVLILLPESLPAEKRSQVAHRVSGPNLAMLWKSLFGPLGFLLFLAFLVNFALANFEGIFGLYAGHQYNYGPEQVGSVFTVIGLVSSMVQLALTGPATRRFGEPLVIKLSLVATAVGFLAMLTVRTDALIALTVGFFVFSNAMLRPAIMSLTSKLSQDGQGMAMGLNNAFQSLGRVVGPLWAGFLFDYNINLPYSSAAVILLLAFGFALWSMRPRQMEMKYAFARGGTGSFSGDD